LLPLWWAAWLAAGIGGAVATRITVTSPDAFALVTLATIAVDVVLLAAALLVALVVQRINHFQSRGERFAPSVMMT
jgi:hypothetical protein